MRKRLTGYVVRFNHQHTELAKDLDQPGRYRFGGHSVISGKRKNDCHDVDDV
ncbi:MAG: hypothetical protein JRL30_08115 [Deltaproteobacteria bacterium]|nr:hypothetical protein [Deltaproteobacteria bacterium]